MLSVLVFFLLTTAIKEAISDEAIDESCILECDSQSKISIRSKYCEQCLRMPIRFGRSDGNNNDKLANIIKSMWNNPEFHYIPKQLLHLYKSKRNPQKNLNPDNEDFSDMMQN